MGVIDRRHVAGHRDYWVQGTVFVVPKMGNDGRPRSPRSLRPAPLMGGIFLSTARARPRTRSGGYACTIDSGGQVRVAIYRPTNWLMRLPGKLLVVDVGY